MTYETRFEGEKWMSSMWFCELATDKIAPKK